MPRTRSSDPLLARLARCLPTARVGVPLVAVVATLAATCLLGSATAGSARPPYVSSGAWEPPPHTLVGVSGTRADGFTLERYDGSTLFPPTLSEARAECSEYDTRLARVRCRVEVRTWYRDLAGLKLSLRWAEGG